MADQPMVDPHYARTGDYAKDLREIQEADVCPFCPENFRWHPNPILYEDGDWFATAIRETYPNAERHYLIIGREHKEHIQQLTSDDTDRVLRLASRLLGGDLDIGGALTVRFGPTRYTGATVNHLHFHLIVPEIDPKTNRAKTVNFPIG